MDLFNIDLFTAFLETVPTYTVGLEQSHGTPLIISYYSKCQRDTVREWLAATQMVKVMKIVIITPNIFDDEKTIENDISDPSHVQAV